MAIEAVDPRARGLRNRPLDDAYGIVGLTRRLDWVLIGAAAGAVAFGLWAIGGITRHDPGGSAAPRQALYVAVGTVVLIVAVRDPAERVPAPLEGALCRACAA